MPSRDGHRQSTCAGCRERDARIGELQERVGQLEERIAELERAGHRQAAPFRRSEEKRKQAHEKRPPGRKTGQAAAYRRRPPVVDERQRVPLTRCPKCHGPVTKVRSVKQVIEDIPEVRIRRLQLTTSTGRCRRCGRVRSTHPEQVSTAVAAAGTQVGRNALALAADWNKHFGLPLRKTCRILEEHFGWRLTPGGLRQALARVAGKLATPYQELCQAVRHSSLIHADETSWWLANQGAWWWVFTPPALTLYTLDRRSQEVVRRVWGDDFAGVLVSDCRASYAPPPGRKSKCCAQHLQASSAAQQLMPPRAFLADLRRFCDSALLRYRLRDVLPADEYPRRVAYLPQRRDELLAPTYSLADELAPCGRAASPIGCASSGRTC